MTVTLYPFDHDHGVPAKTLAHLLGGKGSGLAEMTRALGIAVPPGFTIPLPVAQDYREHGFPDDLGPALASHMNQLGVIMNRHFGDERDPLLVAVRSGAPVSMPGMLDTVLNLGLNDQTVEGLARISGDPQFAQDSYRRFVHMFATTVMGVRPEALEGAASASELTARVRRETGEDVPSDPHEQLRRAVIAVFESWDSARAKAYRKKEKIAESMATAVNVQAMVFGNRGETSGTGVVFTRNPSTGASAPYGDYLPRAQGEDVVAGKAHTLPIAELAALLPNTYDELVAVLRRLEVHYRDMCDVEFTVEQGRLWLLQARVGKRGAVAAVRIAHDLVHDPDIQLARDEAASRVTEDLLARARQEILEHAGTQTRHDAVLAAGLGASPGRVSGRIVLDSESAAESEGPVILVRPQTSPEDVAGMASSVGILTTTGGLVSHAAVVARGWGIPAVVGARDFVICDEIVKVGDIELRAGDLITIDGTTGEVWRGEHLDSASAADAGAVLQAQLPELSLIEACLSDSRIPARASL